MKIEVIQEKLSEELIAEARNFSLFRKKVKEYLQMCGRCYDKFTITDRDSFLGYISERAVETHIREKYGTCGIEVSSWSSGFDMEKIFRIVSNKLNNPNNIENPEDIEYVTAYFYDKYDLRISYMGCRDREIKVDVKTAETIYVPSNSWKFLYPVVQNEKAGKEYVILAYYRKNSINTLDFKEIDLCGFLSENEIKQYPVQKQGTKTIQNTISQIDNYCTCVGDYRSLDILMKSLLRD